MNSLVLNVPRRKRLSRLARTRINRRIPRLVRWSVTRNLLVENMEIHNG